MSVIRLDVGLVKDESSLLELLAQEFLFPGKTGFDGAISYLADLEWFGTENGFLIIVTGLDVLMNAATRSLNRLIAILPAVLDRMRTRGTRCHYVLVGSHSVLQSCRKILREENRKLLEAAERYPWLHDVRDVPLVEYGMRDWVGD
ncbi:barstar family protein [Dactylosporangium darangshiense]